MIVKLSTLTQTDFMQKVQANPVGKTLTVEDLDQPLGWPLNIDFLDDIQHLDIPVAFVDGTDVLPRCGALGVTTTFLGTNEPAIVMYVTRNVPQHLLNGIFVHEYRHAMQYRQDRLRIEGDDLYWLGVKTPHLPVRVERTQYVAAMEAIDKLRYMAQPWEFEADHMVRNCSLPDMVFHRLIKRYGTTWPTHWSPEYVAKRWYALKSWHLVLEELKNEGF